MERTVTGRRVDLGAQYRPAQDDSVDGLLRGLSAINPGIGRFIAAKDEEAAKAAHLAEQQALQEEKVAAKTQGMADAATKDPNEPVDVALVSSQFRGLAGSIYRDAYRAGVAERMGGQLMADFAEEYAQKRDQPDFNLDAFLAEKRQSALSGLGTDMQARMSGLVSNFEEGTRKDFLKVSMERLKGQREESMSAFLRNRVVLGKPDSIAEDYFANVLPEARRLGVSPAESAQHLLRHLTSLSDAAGGRPELFDTLTTVKGPGGFAIYDANPALQPAIRAAKAQAQAQLDGRIAEGSMAGNALLQKALDERVAANPHQVEFTELLGYLGKNSLFKTDDQVVSYWNGILKAREEKAGSMVLMNQAALGQLFMNKPEDQRKVMDMLLAPELARMQASIAEGKPEFIAEFAQGILRSHLKAGSNEPSQKLQQMFEFISMAPQGDTPPPLFKASAEVYRALEANPQLRDAYFGEKGSKVMKAYLAAAEAQMEPKAAYAAAYAVVSPEAERRADAFKATDDFKKKLGGITKWVYGSSWWPKSLGGNGRPENSGQLIGEAQEYASNLVKRNPMMTDSEVMAATEEWAGKTFVLDPTSGVTVKIPPNASKEITQAAIAEYTAKLAKDNQMADLPSGWRLGMIPDNRQQGVYSVAAYYNGVPLHPFGKISVDKMVDDYRVAKLWSADDAAVLKAAELGTSKDPMAVEQALAKARKLGVMPDAVKRLDDSRKANVQSLLANRLKWMGEQPTSEGMYPTDRKVRTDHGATALSAQRFLDTAMGGATGLASSLISMGEGLALTAYDDPAHGAGKNIGFGYNLKANAAHVDADLKAAMVPPQHIEGVKAGTHPLSQDQAERLLLRTVGRYERLAQAQVNEKQPGLWERLPPQQRAVLTDIAYQVGDVSQFKNALSSLVSGDDAGFKANTKVFYTARDGSRKEDTRRKRLRDFMLAGTSSWQSVVQEQAKR